MFIFNIRLQIKFDTNKEYIIEEKENTLNYFAVVDCEKVSFLKTKLCCSYNEKIKC